MSITLFVRRRAQAGQAAVFLAAAQRVLSEVGPLSPLRSARLFQGLDDPGLFAWLTDWESIEALRAAPEAAEFRRAHDQWAAGPPEWSFFRAGTWYADISRPTVVAQLVLVELPETGGADALVLGAGPGAQLTHTQPGLVARTLYAGEENPRRYLVVNGWVSVDAWEQFRADTMPRLHANLQARGVTITYFVGQTEGEYARPVRRRVPG